MYNTLMLMFPCAYNRKVENRPGVQHSNADFPCAYNHKVEYRPGVKHSNADVLSRLPLPEAISEVPEAGEIILLMENVHLLPVTARQIRQWTDRDSVLSNIQRLAQFGWETTSDVSLKPFQQRKEELSVHDRCILWEDRVIVPLAGHSVLFEYYMMAIQVSLR